MQTSPDRDGEGPDLGEAFGDPAFASCKARGAPLAILRPDTDAVLWANAAAARHWNADDAVGLARVLFGSRDGEGLHGGWLDGLLDGVAPGRPPRLARTGLARGPLSRTDMALTRAWTGADGATLIGLAVPDAAPDPENGAWRRPVAWVAGSAARPDGPERQGAVPAPADDGEDAGADAAEAGPALARRSQLAVLRDRLGRAVDGASTLRFLWRTDAAGTVTAFDAAAFARLGSPLRFEGFALPDAVAPFDPAGAERLRSALATRATWSGLCLDLPVADAAAAVSMTLGGSPVFGPGRAFAGFRGFGTVDLGRLALAPRRAPAGGPGEEGAGPEAAPHREEEVSAPTGAAEAPAVEVPPLEEPVRAAEGAPRGEPGPPANVVQFRAFQGAASGRFGAVPQPDGPAGPSAERPAAGAQAGLPAGEDGAPFSDQLAFLALGEALRARIGLPDPASAPSDAAVPAAMAEDDQPSVPAHELDEPASRLLDRLPIPVLATVGERPVFANAAAASRFGHADPRHLLGPGEAVAVLTAGPGRISLTDARGRTVSSAARRVDVPWAGASATLWLLAEPDAALPVDGSPPQESSPAEPRAEPARRDGVEDRSADLLDRVDDAVALLDAAGRLRRLNRRGETWFGPVQPEPARTLADLLAPESRPAALALLAEVRDGRDGFGAPPLRRDVLARAGGGAPAPMLLTLGRLGASGFYATLRDTSALFRAETDRIRTERDHARAAGRLPDLLAKVGHGIRTPLGAILGFAEVMMDERLGPLGNPRYKDYLKDVHAAGAGVVALVDDLLDLSRIEAGQVDLDVAAVDVNRVVTEAVAQMQPEAHRGRVIMRMSLGGRVPSVLADERSARQIVRNLLSNAVRFNEPGGQVIVSTALGEAGAVLLRVRDTGVGMTDDAIAAALEPFGGVPARPATGGNGLGLPLTRALVGANGASMTIRSRPREGTLVEVCFAAAEPGGARRPAW